MFLSGCLLRTCGISTTNSLPSLNCLSAITATVSKKGPNTFRKYFFFCLVAFPSFSYITVDPDQIFGGASMTTNRGLLSSRVWLTYSLKASLLNSALRRGSNVLHPCFQAISETVPCFPNTSQTSAVPVP